MSNRKQCALILTAIILKLTLWVTKYLPIFSLILLALNTGSGQTGVWYLMRGYDSDDESWGVAVDTVGYIYWATTEQPPGSSWHKIFIYKIDAEGHEVWRSSATGSDNNEMGFITVVKEPFVYVGGRIDSSGQNQNLLVRAFRMVADSLIQEWEYRWDLAGFYEEVDGICVRDSALYISGWASPQRLNQDIVIQQLDLNGRLGWSRVWGIGTGLEGANGHMAVDGQSIYIASHYGPLGRQGNALLIAFDQDNGTHRWSVTWGRPDSDDAFFGLEMSADSFLYVVGPSPMGGQSDIYLVKYTRSGTELWERRWGGPQYETGRAIAVDGDSIIYVAGYTTSYGAGLADIFLLKYSSDGTLLDFRVWGGPGDDQVHDLTIAGDYLFLTGATRSFGADRLDALLIKVNKRTLLFPDTIQGIGTEQNHFDQFYKLTATSPVFRTAQISFSIPKPAAVTVEVFNQEGRKIGTVVKKFLGAGSYTVRGLDLRPGVYFLKLKAGLICRVAKIVFQR